MSRALVGLGITLGIALPLALGRAAAAHWTPPETIVAELNATGRGLGVDRAERDAKVPRLLVIRVSERWYALPPAARKSQATDWLGRWRESVPQGIVAVLDARTAKPVVEFGARGLVEGVTGPPP